MDESYIPIQWNGDRYECMYEWKQMEKLGGGAYGSVYKSCCGYNCNYVMKVVRFNEDETSEVFLEETTLEEFQQEIEMQRKLAKVGVAPRIYDAWKSKTLGFFIMERLDKTLLRFLKEEDDNKKIDDIMDKVIDKIELMHKLDIIHGDLHSSNIMLNSKDEPYIIDFGMARNTLPIGVAILHIKNLVGKNKEFIGLVEWSLAKLAKDFDHLRNSLGEYQNKRLEKIIHLKRLEKKIRKYHLASLSSSEVYDNVSPG